MAARISPLSLLTVLLILQRVRGYAEGTETFPVTRGPDPPAPSLTSQDAPSFTPLPAGTSQPLDTYPGQATRPTSSIITTLGRITAAPNTPLNTGAAPYSIKIHKPDPNITLIPKPDPQIILIPKPDLNVTLIPKPDPNITLILKPDPKIILIPKPDLNVTLIPKPDPNITLIPKPDLNIALIPKPDPNITLIPIPIPIPNPANPGIPLPIPPIPGIPLPIPPIPGIPLPKPAIPGIPIPSPSINLIPRADPDINLTPIPDPDITLNTRSSPDMDPITRETPDSTSQTEITPYTSATPKSTIQTGTTPNVTLHTTAAPKITLHTTAAPNTTLHTSAAPTATLHTSAAPTATLHTSAAPNTTLHTTAAPNTTLHTTPAPNTTLHTTAAPNTTMHTTAAPNTTLHTTAAPSSSLHTGATLSTPLDTGSTPYTSLEPEAAPNCTLPTGWRPFNELLPCQQDADCPPFSSCIQLEERRTCHCDLGLILHPDLGCVTARTFPARIAISALTMDRLPGEERSPAGGQKLPISRQVESLFWGVFGHISGYLSTSVTEIRPDEDYIIITHLFSTLNPITEEILAKELTLTPLLCPNGNHSCASLLTADSYQSLSLCEFQMCDSASSSCESQSGLVTCLCRPGYYQFSQTDRLCRACESGFHWKNGRCQRCPFGYGGFQCEDASLLAVVLESCLLIVFLVALVTLLFYYLRIKKKKKKPKASFMESITLEVPTDRLPLPRAQFSWRREWEWMKSADRNSESPPQEAAAAAGEQPSSPPEIQMRTFGDISRPSVSSVNRGSHNLAFITDD